MTFPILGGNGAVATYSIDNSLRFNDSDSPYLSQTPNASNRRTFSISFWVKRGTLGTNASVFAQGGASTDQTRLRFVDDDSSLFFDDEAGGTTQARLITNRLFRDASAWYHIVIVVNTPESTSSDRIKLYVNGVQETSFATSNYPSQNHEMFINTANAFYIGREVEDNYFDGYLAEMHFIDGQAKAQTDFGEFDAGSGIWKPIEYSGTYGTNGFYVDFENSGSLGADQSGNGNNFTPTNLTSTDQTTDTPTNNFATLNPLAKARIASAPYDGNLSHVGQTSGYEQTVLGTIAIPAGTGKWYWESKMTGANTSGIGVVATDVIDGSDYTATYTTSSTPIAPWRYNYGWGVIGSTGDKKHDNSSSAYSTGDLNQVRQVAIDCENGKIYFGVNNVWGDSGNPATGTNPAYTDTDLSTKNIIPWSAVSDIDGRYRHMNFGNPNAGFNETTNESDENGFGKFKYAPPSGYLALCTQNLATALSPTIDDGSQYFNTVLYTGTGSSLGVTGVGFQPDWTWIKGRSGATEHVLTDSSRGVTEELNSNDTSAEETVAQGLTAFGTDGFTVGTDGSYNTSSATYASWNWLANGGTTSSNTDGSITSTVQANTTAGFSIVTYTGTGSNATVGHGLGVTPDCFVVKRRSAVEGWTLYHKNTSSTPQGDHLLLNSDTATVDQADIWNDTAPTSSVFSVGINTATNDSGSTYVAYCFAEIEGYSKFGIYTGNGSTDGPFVYTGFRPAFVLWKRTDSATDWIILDTTRDSFNVANKRLFPNKTSVENTGQDTLDFLSNGFKHRATNSRGNASGGTYIYMAFAEHPFVTSTAIPVTAR